MASGDSGISVHAGGGEGSPAARPAARTSRPAEAKNAVDYLGLTAQGSKLRKDGEEFVKNVVDETAKYEVELKVTKVPDTNYEARVLSYNGYAIVLIFHDTFQSHDKMNIPSVSCTKDIIRSLEIKGVTDTIVEVIVVTNDMYQQYDRMAVSIVNTLRAADETTFKDMTIGDLKASGEIHANLNLKEVIAFAETTTGSPVAHADSGAIIYVKQRVKNNSGYGIGDDVKTIAIGAVTGYTEFKRVPVTATAVGGTLCQYKYDPSFIVTGVYSPIRTKEFAAFLIAAAHDIFIARGLWINAFSSFGEGERNLGSLFINPETKKPWKIQNFAQREALMRQHFVSTTPLFAVDLQEGRDQFPGLKDFLSNPESIKNIIKSFTGDARILDFPIQQGDDVVQFRSAATSTPSVLRRSSIMRILAILAPSRRRLLSSASSIRRWISRTPLTVCTSIRTSRRLSLVRSRLRCLSRSIPSSPARSTTSAASAVVRPVLALRSRASALVRRMAA